MEEIDENKKNSSKVDSDNQKLLGKANKDILNFENNQVRRKIEGVGNFIFKIKEKGIQRETMIHY